MRYERKKWGLGFTLVELLLATVIISTLVIAVGYALRQGLDSFSLIIDRREAIQKARLAVNMMSNELVTIADPATDISAISATSITFTPATGGSVTYTISVPNLLRGAKTLATNITANSRFDYYTTLDVSTTTPSAVHRIHIRLEVDTGVAGHGLATINTNVYLRNRYYNAFIQN